MNLVPTTLPEVLSIRLRLHVDARGFVKETWRAGRYAAFEFPDRFVQDTLYGLPS